MSREGNFEFEDTFEINLDGESDPITPLSAADRARLEKLRDAYMKAGDVPRNPELFEIDLDGESDPITPLSPTDRARIEKLRDAYIKAGRIRAPETTEPDPPTIVDLYGRI